MSKNFFLGYFMMGILCLGVFIGCTDTDKEDETPSIPVIGDIVAKYASVTLNATINGVPVSNRAAITVIKEQDNSMTLRLINIIPGVPSFNLPKSTFEVDIRSFLPAKISGARIDSLMGYDVMLIGDVTDSVMTAAITLKEMQGEPTDMATFYNKTFRGDMAFNMVDMPDTTTCLQRIYVSKPLGGDASSIKLQINKLQYLGFDLGNVTLDTIKVLKRGDVYGFKAERRKITVASMGEVLVNVYGSIVDNKMRLSFEVTAGSALTNITFGGEQVTESTDAKIKIVIPGNNILEQPQVSGLKHTFKVWSSVPASALVLIPEITLAQGAMLDSVVIYNDTDKSLTKTDRLTAVDFSKLSEKSCVRYYVTPEDVRRPSTMSSLYISLVEDFIPLYTMEEWSRWGNTTFSTPVGLFSNLEQSLMLNLYGVFADNLRKGVDNAAEIVTNYSVSPTTPNTTFSGVVANLLFNGQYVASTDNHMLSCAKLGELYRQVPNKFKFTYKYTPGERFLKTIVGDSIYEGKMISYHTTEAVAGEKDELLISAYLYEVSNLNESLNETTIHTSPTVIMKAVFTDGAMQTNYVDKEISFTPTGNRTYDATKLYKLAVFCSPSKKYNLMMGAPGSLLSIRRLEVVAQ